MNIIISHKSALEYWRWYRRSRKALLVKQRRINLPVGIPKVSKIEEILPANLSHPVDLLFASQKDRRKSSVVRPYAYGGPPPDFSFMRICEGVLISSPDFCLFQLAGHLSLVKLIELGFELCGTYSLRDLNKKSLPEKKGFSSPDLMNERPAAESANKDIYGYPQLTNTRELTTCASRLKGVRWHSQFSRAIRYVIDGSASPMETKLVMLLTLPYKLGGYGLSMPEMNKRIDTGKIAKHRLGKSYYVCDLFWPDANLAVEYDSNEFHIDSEQIAGDSRKRLDLAKLGIDVITVTVRQISDLKEFDDLAELIAKRLHKRLQYDRRKFRKAQRELRRELL